MHLLIFEHIYVYTYSYCMTPVKKLYL